MTLTRDGLWGSASAIRRIHGGGSLASPWCDETVGLTDLTSFRIGVAGQMYLKIKLHAKQISIGSRGEERKEEHFRNMEDGNKMFKNEKQTVQTLSLTGVG